MTRAKLLILSLGLGLSFPVSLFAQGVGSQMLHGHVPRLAKVSPDLGAMDPTQTIDLAIGLPLRNQDQLQPLLDRLYDPHSPLYRKFLTADQFNAQFCPSESDYRSVVAFAQAHHLTVTGTYSNRLLVDVRGNVSEIQQALHVNLRRYQRQDGSWFHAPDREPSVDLDTPIQYVAGLENSKVPQPAGLLKPKPQQGTGFPVGTPPHYSYLGNDFRNVYLPCLPSSVNGAGQTVALIEFDSYNKSDISNYTAAAGIVEPFLNNVVLSAGAFPGANNSEVCLDIEMSMAMAPGASVYVYEDQDGVKPTDSMLNRILVDKVSRQISCSWSFGGDANTAAFFAAYAAQGDSFFEAAGDSGAYIPADPVQTVSDPIDLTSLMTVVGGTELFTSGTGGTSVGTYTSESVWNDSLDIPTTVPTPAPNAVASGGICDGPTPVAIPTYQVPAASGATGVGASTVYRNLPDVSLTADFIEVYYTETSPSRAASDIFGGTSASAPLWAGVMALVNQEAVSLGRGPVGLANPSLYNLASDATTYANDFHDVTTGNNNYWHTSSTYPAASGFDLASGLGSPKCNLIADMALAAPTVTLTFTVTLTPTITNTRTVTPTKTPTLTITPTPTVTLTRTITLTPTRTLSPTVTNTPTITYSPTITNTPTISDTPTITDTPTVTPTVPATDGSYVYPQPATDQVNLVYLSDTDQTVRINYYAFSGQLVATLTQNAQAATPNLVTLAIGGFAPGVYFYVVHGSGGQVVAKGKFLVRR
jgi:subtilase family serine protease